MRVRFKLVETREIVLTAKAPGTPRNGLQGLNMRTYEWYTQPHSACSSSERHELPAEAPRLSGNQPQKLGVLGVLAVKNTSRSSTNLNRTRPVMFRLMALAFRLWTHILDCHRGTCVTVELR